MTLDNNSKTIGDLSYPDFVSLFSVQNTPPNPESTFPYWLRNGRFSTSTKILDLACSTGYSLCRILKHVSGSGIGIDLSDEAIENARRIVGRRPERLNVSFQVADASKLPFKDKTFTHVIAGSCFGFIAKRDQALRECFRVLQPRGKLLISQFYYTKTPPAYLLQFVNAAVGYRPDARRTLGYWRNFFSSKFRLSDVTICRLRKDTTDNISSSVRNLMRKGFNNPKSFSASSIDVAHVRLLLTRLILNEHKAYQGLLTAVYERR